MSTSDPRAIRISDVTYQLPDARIPRYPSEQRDQSKLLVFKAGDISERLFHQLPDVLPASSLLVFNESKVIPARLIFKNEKSQDIEVFCLEPNGGNYEQSLSGKSESTWRCLTGGLKKWKADELLKLKSGGVNITAHLDVKEPSSQIITFSWQPENLSFSEVIELTGELPIPPYLERKSEEIDKDRYQTVYSRTSGSVAAPTAGLHFTPQLLDKLRLQGFEAATLVLHVGAGTFKPVKSETLEGHEMHAEWMVVHDAFLDKLLREQNRPVIPVGTTSLRALESLYWLGSKVFAKPDISPGELSVGQWDPYDLNAEISTRQSLTALKDWLKHNGLRSVQVQTRILIAPPYKLRIARALITNFHQPDSTLLVLVSAVIGKHWKEVYQYALDHQFRFLSYGDSSLLIPGAD